MSGIKTDFNKVRLVSVYNIHMNKPLATRIAIAPATLTGT